MLGARDRRGRGYPDLWTVQRRKETDRQRGLIRDPENISRSSSRAPSDRPQSFIRSGELPSTRRP
jgi:hypothetical protein